MARRVELARVDGKAGSRSRAPLHHITEQPVFRQLTGFEDLMGTYVCFNAWLSWILPGASRSSERISDVSKPETNALFLSPVA
jgi:hypothetical protein